MPAAPVINVDLSAVRRVLGASTPQTATVIADSTCFYTLDLNPWLVRGYLHSGTAPAVAGQQGWVALSFPAGLNVDDLVVQYASVQPIRVLHLTPEQRDALTATGPGPLLEASFPLSPVEILVGADAPGPFAGIPQVQLPATGSLQSFLSVAQGRLRVDNEFVLALYQPTVATGFHAVFSWAHA